MDFLDHVKDDFVAKYDGGEAPTATPNNFNKDFGYFAFVSTFFCKNSYIDRKIF